MSIFLALILANLCALCVSAMAISSVSSVAGNICKTMEQVASNANIHTNSKDIFQLPTINTAVFDVQSESPPIVIKQRIVKRKTNARKLMCESLDAIVQTPMTGMQCTVM